MGIIPKLTPRIAPTPAVPKVANRFLTNIFFGRTNLEITKAIARIIAGMSGTNTLITISDA